MTLLKITVAVALLLLPLAASPVFAQAAISEPGAFSFYHPDRDVLNSGVPIWGGRAAPSSASQAYAAAEGGIVHHVRRNRSVHSHH